MGMGDYAGFQSWEHGSPMLDLHGFSEGAAETALRWWVEDLRTSVKLGARYEKLIIVTGWGKSRPVTGQGDLYKRTCCVLADMGLPTLSSTIPRAAMLRRPKIKASRSRSAEMLSLPRM